MVTRAWYDHEGDDDHDDDQINKEKVSKGMYLRYISPNSLYGFLFNYCLLKSVRICYTHNTAHNINRFSRLGTPHSRHAHIKILLSFSLFLHTKESVQVPTQINYLGTMASASFQKKIHSISTTNSASNTFTCCLVQPNSQVLQKETPSLFSSSYHPIRQKKHNHTNTNTIRHVPYIWVPLSSCISNFF